MVTIQIEVISDIVCVWCFIGKRTMERAISLFQKTYPGGKDDTFAITWKPYYLNYNRFVSSIQSVDKSEIAQVKFQGVSEEKMAAMSNRVNQIGRANGIDFKFGGKIGSTQDAHRLIHFAQTRATPEVQDRVVEELFHKYHEREIDITALDALVRIGVEAGLQELELKGYLASDSDTKELDDDEQMNRVVATTGVPTFIIQGKYRVNGAQDLEEFFDAFVKVREAEISA